MDLTPPERQRIYAEEKARLEAQARLKTEANQSKTNGIGIGCAVLLGVVLLLGTISQFFPDKTPSAPTDFDAYIYSKKFVERQLKAPSTAKFCDYDEASVSTADGSFVVTGWVDAQNSFGAMIRNGYVCKLHKAGDTWHLDDINLIPR
jgi:hypothetical protein